MEIIERHVDVMTGNMSMEDLHTMQDFPVFMGCVNFPADEDIRAELTWQINRNNGVLQLKKLIPLETLYQAQHDPGTVGTIWMDHHNAFADFLKKFEPKSVLELGGAHGILALEYFKYKELPWTIIEPNPTPVQGCKARFLKGFFNENFRYNDYFDTIVHSHVFEHIYNPNEFVKYLSEIMNEGQNLVFSLPNLSIMLQKNFTNALNFEHTVFLTEPYIDFLLSRHGFKVLERQYFREDHSIFYGAVRDSKVADCVLPLGLYEENRKLYLNFVSYHKNLIDKLNERMAETDKPIYLFGAHVFAQYLLEMGLNTAKILCLLDNDPKKHGLRLYGSKLNVLSPSILKNIDSPVIILKAGVYNNEIKKDILENINNTAVFFE